MGEEGEITVHVQSTVSNKPNEWEVNKNDGYSLALSIISRKPRDFVQKVNEFHEKEMKEMSE